MIDIKFRVWDKEDKKMLLWDNCKQEICDAIPWDAGDEWTERCVVMQYTGLKDKNGREIYESDIVKVDGKAYTPTNKPVVTWGEVSHGWSLKCYTGDEYVEVKYYGLGRSKNIEIVGNIFEKKHNNVKGKKK